MPDIDCLEMFVRGEEKEKGSDSFFSDFVVVQIQLFQTCVPAERIFDMLCTNVG